MRWNKLPLIFAAVAIAAWGVPRVAAQIPSNDHCSGEIVIGTGSFLYGHNFNATTGPEPIVTGFGSPGADVWYRYTASCTGNATVTLCPVGGQEADFDTIMAAWSGTCANLQLITWNDDACGSLGLSSEVTFGVTAGTDYRISVFGYEGEMGNFTITVSACTSVSPPPNDTCTMALVLSDGAQVSGSNVSASTGPDPLGSCGGAQDVWYRFTPGCSGAHTVQYSIGATLTSAAVTVFDGSAGCGSLVEVACGSSWTPNVSWTATAGVPYYISLAGLAATVGTFAMQLLPGPPGSVTLVGQGCNLGGGAAPSLGVSGTPAVGATLSVSILGAPPGSGGEVWISNTRLDWTGIVGGCSTWLDLSSAIPYRSFTAGPSGNATFTDTIPSAPWLHCLVVRMQAYAVPPGGNPSTLTFTNALEIVIL